MTVEARSLVVVAVAVAGIWGLHALLASRAGAAPPATLAAPTGQPLSGPAGNIMGNW